MGAIQTRIKSEKISKMKIEMTKSEIDRYWRQRRERVAKRVKALEAKGNLMTSEIEKYQEDLDEILTNGSYK